MAALILPLRMSLAARRHAMRLALLSVVVAQTFLSGSFALGFAAQAYENIKLACIIAPPATTPEGKYALGIRISIAAVVHYNRTARTTEPNVRLRCRLAEGMDLWIVDDDLLSTNCDPLQLGAPAQPFSKSRTFLPGHTRTLAY